MVTSGPVILFYNSMWTSTLEIVEPGRCRMSTDRRDLAAADAVVFHLPTMLEAFPEKHPGQIWVAWTLESDVNYPRQRDPQFMAQFDLRMSYHLDADVPTPYIGSRAEVEQSLRRPPSEKHGLATMFVSSPLNRSKRIDLARELMLYLDIHSYGKRHNNRHIPQPDLGRETKLAVLAGYKFDLSFENAIDRDYVTEKFYDPLLAGSVPVYLGAPNVDQFTPGEHCFINAADFANGKELAEYLLHLDADDNAYAKYFTWKTGPFRPEFLDLLARTEESALDRLCRMVCDRKQ
jgi:hypothetical protein